MATYQFYIATIPKKGVLQYFGEVPRNLNIDFQKRTEQFLHNELEDEFDYFELVQNKCWELSQINPIELIKEVDKKLTGDVYLKKI